MVREAFLRWADGATRERLSRIALSTATAVQGEVLTDNGALAEDRLPAASSAVAVTV
jgi:hypothetical protein